jgi:tripartite-type tricarboxylate transporter receptor subunit TctC
MYKASPQAIGDVAAGRVDFMAADFVTAMPQMSGGRVRVLAVADDRRSALLPNVPAVAETLKGFSCGSWNGLFVPAGTPKAIVDRLARETLDILARPDVVARLAGIGFEVAPLGPVPFAAYLREQSELWGRRIRDAGIQPQ